MAADPCAAPFDELRAAPTRQGASLKGRDAVAKACLRADTHRQAYSAHSAGGSVIMFSGCFDALRQQFVWRYSDDKDDE